MPDYKAKAKAAAIKRDKKFAANNPGLAELRRFVRSFEKFPADLRKDMRKELLTSVQKPLQQAKANAGWSTRIPKATKIQTSFSKKKAGVAIVVNRHKAPHARPLEHGGRPGFVRHPVMGNREKWVRQPARPFLWPAAAPWQREMDKNLLHVVDTVATRHGFR